MTVYKFDLTFERGGIYLNIPVGAKPLSVGMQGIILRLWVFLDPDDLGNCVPRRFEVFGTRDPIPYLNPTFIGTVFIEGYFFHVFETSNLKEIA
jgi:hypothetical protein